MSTMTRSGAAPSRATRSSMTLTGIAPERSSRPICFVKASSPLTINPTSCAMSNPLLSLPAAASALRELCLVRRLAQLSSFGCGRRDRPSRASCRSRPASWPGASPLRRLPGCLGVSLGLLARPASPAARSRSSPSRRSISACSRARFARRAVCRASRLPAALALFASRARSASVGARRAAVVRRRRRRRGRSGRRRGVAGAGRALTTAACRRHRAQRGGGGRGRGVVGGRRRRRRRRAGVDGGATAAERRRRHRHHRLGLGSGGRNGSRSPRQVRRHAAASCSAESPA